ncbi:MAG: hypothetical protein V4687_16065 [Bacteroidota bacterium]
MKTPIVSFHNGNLHPDIVRYQKRVFDHFLLPLLQIETKLSHPEAIDDFLNTKQWESIIIFDIDCIPLNKEAPFLAMTKAKQGKIYGAAQQANHIPESGVYASPAFISFSKDTWKKMNYPSFLHSEFGDVGHELTLYAPLHNVEVELIWPTHVEVPRWNLGKESTFGLGTTYQTGIFHAFESRMGNNDIFVNKCKEVLGENN